MKRSDTQYPLFTPYPNPPGEGFSVEAVEGAIRLFNMNSTPAGRAPIRLDQSSGSIVLPKEYVVDLFEPMLKEIVENIRRRLGQLRDLSLLQPHEPSCQPTSILLGGGCAASGLVQERMKREFAQTATPHTPAVTVTVIPRPCEAVARGAVLSAAFHAYKRSSRLKNLYAICIADVYNASVHDSFYTEVRFHH